MLYFISPALLSETCQGDLAGNVVEVLDVVLDAEVSIMRHDFMRLVDKLRVRVCFVIVKVAIQSKLHMLLLLSLEETVGCNTTPYHDWFVL